MHPYLSQKVLKELCDEKGIRLTAYSPTGKNHLYHIVMRSMFRQRKGYAQVREDPIIVNIAKKHAVTSSQVVMAWHVQRGTSAVPKSTSTVHQKENITVSVLKCGVYESLLMCDIQLPKLAEDDMRKIDGLDRNIHLCEYPDEDKSLVFGWTHEQMGW